MKDRRNCFKLLGGVFFLACLLFTGCSDNDHGSLDPEFINPGNQDFSIIVYVDAKATPVQRQRISTFVSNVANTYPVAGISFQKKKSKEIELYRANCKITKKDDLSSALKYLKTMLDSDGLTQLADVVAFSRITDDLAEQAVSPNGP